MNQRVNYPLKRAMNEILQNDHLGKFDMTDPIFKYCVSWMMLYVAQDAASHLLQSWNYHRLPGSRGCVPVENMMSTKHTADVPDHLIPSTPEAVRMYEENGGRLTRNSDFGYDPLVYHPDLYESREVVFNPLNAKLLSEKSVFRL